VINLHPDWKQILKHAWSIRLIIVAGFFSGLEVALPFFQDVIPVRQGAFGLLSFIAANGAFVFRLIAQKNMSVKDE